MRALSDKVSVSGQIFPDQIAGLVEQGVKTLINHRPDGEGADQPTSAEIEQAARAHGLEYVYIPMSSALEPEIIEAAVQAYQNMPEPVLAYCAGGMRAAVLWGFAHVKALGVDKTMDTIRQAGFNLDHIAPLLENYA